MHSDMAVMGVSKLEVALSPTQLRAWITCRRICSESGILRERSECRKGSTSLDPSFLTVYSTLSFFELGQVRGTDEIMKQQPVVFTSISILLSPDPVHDEFRDIYIHVLCCSLLIIYNSLRHLVVSYIICHIGRCLPC
jgi:hypothetical protein